MRRGHFLPAEREELIGQRDRALGALADMLKVALQRMIRPQPRANQARISGNDREQIVEIIGHASSQSANGFHFLRVQKLRFQLFARGNIPAQNLNGVFATLPGEAIERLRNALPAALPFYVWDEPAGTIRLMCSWDTTEEDVDGLGAAIAAAIH